jgi:two-component system response regulator FixJ
MAERPEMKPKAAKVYIVDDDDAVRDSLGFQLEMAGYAVTGYASGLDFLRDAPTLASGCLILDVRMPEIDGLELQSRLNDLELNFPTIVITGHGDVPLAVRAMKAGAVDFVEKPFSEDALLESISSALQPTRRSGTKDQLAEIAENRIALLSGREREVLEGLVAGSPNKVIAYELNLSPRTVEVHRARVMDKMQARSLSELVRLALAAGVPIRS